MMHDPALAPGDIGRMDRESGTWVLASLVDWHAFFLVRDVSRWAAAMPAATGHTGPWEPCADSWDTLERRLLERFGSVTSRWWDAERVTPPGCLVCGDTHTIAGVLACPACTRPPLPRPLYGSKRQAAQNPSPLLLDTYSDEESPHAASQRTSRR